MKIFYWYKWKLTDWWGSTRYEKIAVISIWMYLYGFRYLFVRPHRQLKQYRTESRFTSNMKNSREKMFCLWKIGKYRGIITRGYLVYRRSIDHKWYTSKCFLLLGRETFLFGCLDFSPFYFLMFSARLLLKKYFYEFSNVNIN